MMMMLPIYETLLGIVTDARELQPENAWAPYNSNYCGITNDVYNDNNTNECYAIRNSNRCKGCAVVKSIVTCIERQSNDNYDKDINIYRWMQHW